MVISNGGTHGIWATMHALFEPGDEVIVSDPEWPATMAIAIAAKAAGVSPRPANDPAQEAELKANLGAAEQLGATGTPLFVVGDRVINSAVGYDGLKEAIAAARKG